MVGDSLYLSKERTEKEAISHLVCMVYQFSWVINIPFIFNYKKSILHSVWSKDATKQNQPIIQKNQNQQRKNPLTWVYFENFFFFIDIKVESSNLRVNQ